VLSSFKIPGKKMSNDKDEEDVSRALISYSEELEKDLKDLGVKKFNYSKFKGIEEVGHGGSSIVYSAVFRRKKYALKSLENNLSINRRRFKEMKRELRLLYHLDHPSIVKFYGISIETSVEFIVNNPEIVPEDSQLMLENPKNFQNNTCKESKITDYIYSEPRLLIVSHFLPHTIVKAVGGYKLEKSSNGLVNILSEFAKSRKFIWFGRPGGNVPEERDKIAAQLKESSYYPVFIENYLTERHDNFSNSTLWPLLHYRFPGDNFFRQEDWEAYKTVNGLFADAINEIVQDNDLIWIHGHHLMFLPEILRKKISSRKLNVNIGYFLHTSFPSNEVYRILPVREEILSSVLKSDLVGFQTLDHAQHFLSSCTSILGLLTKPNRVYYEDRHVHVGIFPIGIDPERFIGSLNEVEVQRHIRDLKEKYKNIKIISSVDQLDYIKGVPQKLHALDLFLTKHPEWIGEVILIQVVKSSRWNTEERNNLRHIVNELDGEISGKFSSFKLSPIHFMHHDLSFEELLALYTVSDVFIVSSLRDGMNLLPYQYISCQKENNGVLILSEFAGAAQCLDVNPWNIDEFSDAIYEAVIMDKRLRKSNYIKLRNYVMNHTISFWGKSFIDELKCIKGYCSQITPHLEINQVLKAANTANKRIILLNYDRTLITHKLTEQSNNIISTLKALQKKSNTYVYILSGHRKVNLDEQFESTGVGLSAEHGCFYKHPKCLQEKVNPILNREGKIIIEEYDDWYRLVEQIDPALKEIVLHLFNHYMVRTPGASIEEKEIGIIWHYCSGPEFELRSLFVDQSTVVRAIFKDLSITQDSFVLCIGDESPDEPIFSLLKNDELKSLNCFTSTVGKKQSNATFFLEDTHDLQNFLVKLASDLSD
ncbi:19020_t:CDS:10, partial [Dentiscutata erythropus]